MTSNKNGFEPPKIVDERDVKSGVEECVTGVKIKPVFSDVTVLPASTIIKKGIIEVLEEKALPDNTDLQEYVDESYVANQTGGLPGVPVINASTTDAGTNDNYSDISGVFQLSEACKVMHVAEIVNDNSLAEIKRVYRALSNVPATESNGAAYEHALLMKSLYPVEYLFLLEEFINKVHDKSEEIEIKKERAILTLRAFIQMVEEYAHSEFISYYEAFQYLYSQWAVSKHNIIEKMEEARHAAMDFIRYCSNNHKDIGQRKFAGVAGKLSADGVIAEYDELEKGVELTPEFVDKLIDRKTKVVVISLDFNSTLNLHESYATPPLLHMRYRAQVDQFVLKFRRICPGKKLVVVINTGRPGDYVWGVIESSTSSMREIREVAFAESGGAILDKGIQGHKRCSIEINPTEWKEELDEIRDFIIKQIREEDVVVEPKLSMLSIRIDGGNKKKCHKSVSGEEVNPKWVEKTIDEYFRMTLTALDVELQRILMDLCDKVEGVKVHAAPFLKAREGSDIGARISALESISPLTHLMDAQQQKQMKKILKRFQVLHEMYQKKLLEVKYNPTAGFVDIGHKFINKYNALMKYVKGKYNVACDEVLFTQVGDSNTDMIPTTLTGPGEPNEGADDAFLVTVNNCSEELYDAMMTRNERGHGMWTYNDSIMGVMSFFRALNLLIEGKPATQTEQSGSKTGKEEELEKVVKKVAR
jgi:hypothetical protein